MKSLGKGCGKLKHIQYQKSYYLTDKIKQEETDHRFFCNSLQFLIIKYNKQLSIFRKHASDNRFIFDSVQFL